ncbi:hypothetical protein ACX2QB_07910 [Weissella viridescens]
MNETIPTKEDIIERANTTTSRLEMTLKKYQRYSSISNLTRIILSSSIPVLVSMSSHNIKLLIFVSLAGALLSIIQGVDSFYLLTKKHCCYLQTTIPMMPNKMRKMFRSSLQTSREPWMMSYQTLIIN